MKYFSPTSGREITLDPREKFHARWMQRQINDRFGNNLGFEIPITTLTTILKDISEQKFYTVPFADYVPTVVGEGTWGSFLTAYRSYQIADSFETGIINTGGNNSRLATADAGVDALNIRNLSWAKENTWNIFELQEAAKSGNWDLVSGKEESRKTNWDLGLQQVAFLGANGQNGPSGNCLGLLNQPGITTNKTIITAPISSLDPTALKTFCATVYEAYRSNCNRTVKPTGFYVPESDYNGMASQSSPEFPSKTVIEIVREMFQEMTMNKQFKVLPMAYGDQAYNNLGVQSYVLMNHDPKSIRMSVPLDYTNTLANSLNNFTLQNVGYGQFTGVLVLRQPELLYFQY